MRIFIAVLVLILSLQSWTKADDIRDFQIEGISIGDSLLDYLSINEIKRTIDLTKDHYYYLKEPLKYREAYKFDNSNFQTYKTLSFIFKRDDNNYKILFIRGMKEYIENIDLCLQKKLEISNEIENIISNFNKRESNFKSDIDADGDSYFRQTIFTLNSGDEILVSCNNWDEKIRKKNKWTEGLSVVIQKKEIKEWWKNK
jgi:hypothetical protein